MRHNGIVADEQRDIGFGEIVHSAHPLAVTLGSENLGGLVKRDRSEEMLGPDGLCKAVACGPCRTVLIAARTHEHGDAIWPVFVDDALDLA